MKKIPRASAPFPFPIFKPGYLKDALSGRDPGELIAGFEGALSRYFGLEHALVTPSCRTALFFVLEALAFPPGSEVILSPVTHWDMINMLLLRDLRPVFVDFGHRTGSIDPDAIAAGITPRSRAILVTHLHGIPTDMRRISEVAEANGVEIIEDISYGIGASQDGALLGTHGLAAVFSTTHLKPINMLGGGVILTRRQDLASRLRHVLGGVARSPRRRLLPAGPVGAALSLLFSPVPFSLLTYYLIASIDSINMGRFDEFQRGNFMAPAGDLGFVKRRSSLPRSSLSGLTGWQARAGEEQLRALDSKAATFRQNAGFLMGNLERSCPNILPIMPDGAHPVFWQVPIWVHNRTALRRYLFRHHVDTSVGGLICCNDAPAFEHFYSPTPEARRYLDQCLFLPNHPGLSREQLDYLVDLIIRFRP